MNSVPTQPTSSLAVWPTNLVTRPANPLGAVVHCLCGRWNDSGRDSACPDCARAVRGISGFPGRDVHEDRQAFYRLEEEAYGGRDLSDAAACALGLFFAQDPAVREAIRA